jgi:rhodanese-related sulfurtransferase/biotin operon repressor
MSSSPKTAVYEQLARIGKALSAPVRLEILEMLAQSERSVDVLASMTGHSIANTSQHLQQLRQAGLVTSRKQGQFVFYRLAGDEVVNLISTLSKTGETYLAGLHKLVSTFFVSEDGLEAVPAREVLERVRKGLVTVIDVRPPDEYAAGHLPGALSVPLPDLQKRLRDLPKGKEIVAYCRGPYCLMSFAAVKTLRSKGFNARRLEAGMPEWRSAGFPVETGRKP